MSFAFKHNLFPFTLKRSKSIKKKKKSKKNLGKPLSYMYKYCLYFFLKLHCDHECSVVK